MAALEPDGPATSRIFSPGVRNLPQIILRRLASKKNQAVAAAMGRDDSYISKISAGDVGIKLEDLGRFLDALDLKVVDKNQVCVSKEIHLSYKTLAAEYLTLQGESGIQQDWDD